eukprot:TRINITY_DN3843_c0_g1_i3.p1 TRINITY_DN3843_c0_g1~~TRINITY_DN3843_c0_g1_i3.p1  ORF type:complete len:456 (-),score=209.58 TRINITY_DN3843_c0_g1_i3:46-1413(-)
MQKEKEKDARRNPSNYGDHRAFYDGVYRQTFVDHDPQLYYDDFNHNEFVPNVDLVDSHGEDDIERALKESLQEQLEQEQIQKAILENQRENNERIQREQRRRREEEELSIKRQEEIRRMSTKPVVEKLPINPLLNSSRDPRDQGRKLSLEKMERESENFKARFLEQKQEEERRRIERMKRDYFPQRGNDQRLNGDTSSMNSAERDEGKYQSILKASEEYEKHLRHHIELQKMEERRKKEIQLAKLYEENQRRLEEERRRKAEDEGSLIQYRMHEMLMAEREQQESLRHMKEQEERDERELLRIKQLSEFEEAEKEDRKRQEDELRGQMRLKEEEKKKKEIELAEGKRKEKKMKELLAKFEGEQPKNGPNITSIAVRMPEGNRIIRNFDADLPVSYLKDFVIFSSMNSGDENSLFESKFKLVKSAPREELGDDSKRLCECGFAPLSKSLIIVEKCE